MKHRIKYIGMTLALFLAASCSDFLDEVPDNRVEIDTVDKAAQLVANGYNQAAYLFIEWMSDNATNIQGVNKRIEVSDAYEWEIPTSTAQDTPEFYWNGAYEAIAHANEALSRLDELEGDPEKKEAVKGEALLIRAYNHFLLVSLYSKMYNAETAGADLGIPYVVEPSRDLLKVYERGTVQETYNKIEADLLAGLPLLSTRFYSGSGKYHFSKKAAWAFATRFYLFQGNYDKVLEYADLLLGNQPEKYVKDIHHIFATQSGGDNLMQLLNSPDEEANLLLQYKITNFARTFIHGYGMSSQLSRAIFSNPPFNATDKRTQFFFNLGGGAGVFYPKLERLFERENLASETGLPATVHVELRGEEVLFNRMEALMFKIAETNPSQTDLLNQYYATVFADMNAYLVTRYELTPDQRMDRNYIREEIAGALGIDLEGELTQDELEALDYYTPILLFSIVMAEKRKEFVQEGIRWWDNLRFGMEITHVTATGLPLILTADDPRRVLQIPETAIDLGMTPNPR